MKDEFLPKDLVNAVSAILEEDKKEEDAKKKEQDDRKEANKETLDKE